MKKRTIAGLLLLVLLVCTMSGCDSALKYIRFPNQFHFKMEMCKDYYGYKLGISLPNQGNQYLMIHAVVGLEPSADVLSVFDKTIRFTFTKECFDLASSYDAFSAGDAVYCSCSATTLFLASEGLYDASRDLSSPSDGSSPYFYGPYYKWDCRIASNDTRYIFVDFCAEFTEDGTFYYFEGEEPTDDVAAFAVLVDERLELARAEYEAENDAA